MSRATGRAVRTSVRARWSQIGAFRATPIELSTFVLLAAAVAATTLDDGGFRPGSQRLFVALAGAALLSAAALDGAAVAKAARTPLVIALGALAALSVASTAWTVGETGAALRCGLLDAGYGAITVSASMLARRLGRWPFAAVIAVLAFLEALLGLYAVATHKLPNAEWIAGAWRPGGTFQYPPALALLQVAALPVLCALLARRTRALAALAAAAAVLAGAVLDVSHARLELSMTIALLALMVARPSSRTHMRSAAMSVAMLLGVGALLCHILLDVAGRSSEQARVSAAHHASSGPHRTTTHSTDWLHGRVLQWETAERAWLDRPWLGAGAGAYFTASLRHQRAAPILYAHDLPLEDAVELGVPGLLFTLALYAAAGWAVVRARGEPAAWLLGPLIVAFLISNLVDWTWHLAGITALWALATGALVAQPPRRCKHTVGYVQDTHIVSKGRKKYDS